MKYKITTNGPLGNAYAIMGYVTTAMERECEKMGWADASTLKMEKEHYLQDAMSSDYQHLLQVSHQMINKINNRLEEAEDEKQKLSSTKRLPSSLQGQRALTRKKSSRSATGYGAKSKTGS